MSPTKQSINQETGITWKLIVFKYPKSLVYYQEQAGKMVQVESDKHMKWDTGRGINKKNRSK